MLAAATAAELAPTGGCGGGGGGGGGYPGANANVGEVGDAIAVDSQFQLQLQSFGPSDLCLSPMH